MTATFYELLTNFLRFGSQNIDFRATILKADSGADRSLGEKWC
ncbi:MAG: hypothetical protein WBB28_28360 [Crinalium sp.]